MKDYFVCLTRVPHFPHFLRFSRTDDYRGPYTYRSVHISLENLFALTSLEMHQRLLNSLICVFAEQDSMYTIYHNLTVFGK